MTIDVVKLVGRCHRSLLPIRARPLRPAAAIVGALILTAVLFIAPHLIRNRLLGILDLR